MSIFWIVLPPMIFVVIMAVGFLLVAMASRKRGSATHSQPSSTHEDHSHLLWVATMNAGMHDHPVSHPVPDCQHATPSHSSHVITPESSAPDFGSSSPSFDTGSSSIDFGTSSFDSGSSGGGSSGCD